jgi:diguanylate cyclase (GGDEF)-like protein
LDHTTLTSGVDQSAQDKTLFRTSRPIIMGHGSAKMEQCGSCHSGLMGIKQGEVMGAYSAEINLRPEYDIWWQQAKDNALRSLFQTIVLVLLIAFMLNATAFRPLAKLTKDTQRLVEDDLSRKIRFADRPDEIGKIARALEDFRVKLIERKAITVENNYNAYLAKHDALTGLPNRLFFNRKLDEAISQIRDDGRKLAAIIIDIDRFKHINDRHGHDVGDAVLTTAAANMRAILQDGEFVARMGGDEFGAWKIYNDAEELDEFLTSLETALASPVMVENTTLIPMASIGISIWPDHTSQREKLMSNADFAMYRAKGDARNKRSFFDLAMDEVSRKREVMVEDLAKALQRGQLTVQYQRQNSAETRELTGYEALCRWTHPLHGPVSPALFIPLAEETGLICDIGEWVLREACATAAKQSKEITMAVNVSAIQINDAEFPRLVQQILLDTGLSPAQLEIELTETALIQNRDRALHVLRQVKALGVKVAIDDFGVGYSSLETISLFPVDKIKIDRSFIHDLDSHPKAASLVRAILMMGNSLDIPVLAEGVETQAQLNFVRDAGCAQVQGYLFGLPCHRSELQGDSEANAPAPRRAA